MVLIDIWDFTCINCIRTLPYLRAWHSRYRELGLTLLGVHTPEFKFAQNPAQVKAAVGRLGIRWPIVLDNDQLIWRSYANRYWPTLYLVDADGYLRYRHIGEGGYAQTEMAIQELLRSINPRVEFPEPIKPVRPEDVPGAICSPTTPELHIDALGNPSPPEKEPTLLELPDSRIDGHFYLGGWWKSVNQGVTLAGAAGEIILPYHAASVNGTFAPSPDPGDLALGFPEPRIVKLNQDEQSLPKENSTEEIYYENGNARLRVDFARTYPIARNHDVQPRELSLKIEGAGFTVYAFSFGSCINPGQTPLQQKE